MREGREIYAGFPMHSAVHVRSPLQETTHFSCSEGVTLAAGADSVVLCAAAKAIRPKVRMVLVNFIFAVVVC